MKDLIQKQFKNRNLFFFRIIMKIIPMEKWENIFSDYEVMVR